MAYMPPFVYRDHPFVRQTPLRRNIKDQPYATFSFPLRVLGAVFMIAGGGMVVPVLLDGHSLAEDGTAVAAYVGVFLVVFLFGLWLLRWRYTVEGSQLARRGLFRTTRYSIETLKSYAATRPVGIEPGGYFKVKKKRGYLRIFYQFTEGCVPLMEYVFRSEDRAKPAKTAAAPDDLPSSAQEDEPVLNTAYSTGLEERAADADYTPSIYECIQAAVTPEERLPADFYLPEAYQSEEASVLRFAPGARDGIQFYHFGREPGAEEAADELIALLGHCEEDGDETVIAFLRKNRVAVLGDLLRDRLLTGGVALSRGECFFLGRRWASQGRDAELVKLGLVLLSTVDLQYDNESREIILTLGLCDEFTFYVLEAATSWYDANKVDFELAQRVDGWGKIHAVNRLSPTNREIREWVLCHGCENTVMDSYLALTCTHRADMMEFLSRDELTSDQFNGIGVIIRGLLREGPVPGISQYRQMEDLHEVFGYYMDHALKMCTCFIHLRVVLDIRDWCREQEEPYAAVLEDCATLLSMVDWKDFALKAIGAVGEMMPPQELDAAIDAAKRLGADYRAPLFAQMENDPVRFAGYAAELMHDDAFVEKVVTLYESLLPQVPEDSMQPQNATLQVLALLLSGLHRHPGLGEKLVLAVLKSSEPRIRRAACTVLERWRERLRKPVEEISPALANAVAQAAQRDTAEEMREVYASLSPERKTPEDLAELWAQRRHCEDALEAERQAADVFSGAHFFGAQLAQPLYQQLLADDTDGADGLGRAAGEAIAFVDEMWHNGTLAAREIVTSVIFARMGTDMQVWDRFVGRLSEPVAAAADDFARQELLPALAEGPYPMPLHLTKERERLRDILVRDGIEAEAAELTSRGSSHYAVRNTAGGTIKVPVLMIGIATHKSWLALGLNERLGAWERDDPRTDRVRQAWRKLLGPYERYEPQIRLSEYYDEQMVVMFSDCEKRAVVEAVYRHRDALQRYITEAGWVPPSQVYACSLPGYNVVYESPAQYDQARRAGDFERIEDAARQMLAEALPGKEDVLRELFTITFWHPGVEGYNPYGLARQD